FTSKFKDALPYVTNIVNAFSTLPKPRTPITEQTIRPSTVSFDQDRVDIDRMYRGLSRGLDLSSSNPGLANANKVSALGKVLEAKGRLTQQENNINANILNDTKRVNSSILARNVERANEYQDALLS